MSDNFMESNAELIFKENVDTKITIEQLYSRVAVLQAENARLRKLFNQIGEDMKAQKDSDTATI